MNLTPKRSSSGRDVGGLNVLYRGAVPPFVAAILALLQLNSARCDEPLSVCALPSVSVGGLTLLLDPVEHNPIALLSDPDARLRLNRWPVTLQTVWDNPDATGLPRLRVADVVPEFWAQPASWMPFVRGPETYSGLGTELRSRDWAGMPATDRRSYRLDPGLRSEPTPTSVSPPGSGSIRLQFGPASLRLAWNGLAGRVYELHYTPDLGRPFQLIQTVIASDDAEAQIALPPTGSQGFYRLAEVSP